MVNLEKAGRQGFNSLKDKPLEKKEKVFPPHFVFKTVGIYLCTAEFKDLDLIFLTLVGSPLWCARPPTVHVSERKPTEKQESRLTCRPRCFCRKPWRGQISQRSLFYPVCWHRIAWWRNPAEVREIKGEKKQVRHCKPVLLPASCCLFIHAVCQDIKALEHQIKPKCRLNPIRGRLKPAIKLQFPRPANAFITISLLCDACLTVAVVRGIKLTIPCCPEYNHSNIMRGRAEVQKRILKPCTWRRDGCVQKGCGGCECS